VPVWNEFFLREWRSRLFQASGQPPAPPTGPMSLTPCKRAALPDDRTTPAKLPRTCGSVQAVVSEPSVPDAAQLLRWARWRSALSQRPGGKPPWLQLQRGKSWGLGCSFCAAAGRAGRLARFSVQAPVFCNLVDHQKSASHREAVLAAKLGGTTATPAACAPPCDQFDLVWTHLAKHRSHNCGVPGVGTWRKTRRMEWCLAEARRVLHRRFLKRATVASLLQDARQRTLLLRLVATNSELQTRHLVLGLERDYGSGASAVQSATVQAMRNLCTVRGQPPGRRGSPPGSDGPDGPSGQPARGGLDAGLFEHLTSIIEVFAADAALDEQIAGREMQDPSGSNRPDLPNLRLVLRDKAHASRRRGCAISLDRTCLSMRGGAQRGAKRQGDSQTMEG
jgi:hypothetical protein